MASLSKTRWWSRWEVMQQLYSDYEKLSGLLGLPSCSNRTWHSVIEKLEVHVTKFAEWSCSKVRETIKQCGDHKNWIASFDGSGDTTRTIRQPRYMTTGLEQLHGIVTGLSVGKGIIGKGGLRNGESQGCWIQCQ